MKSYWLTHTPQGVVFETRDLPVPQPGPGQIVVRMHAASMNRGELLGAIARHRADTAKPAGSDGAGEVHAVGQGVTGFKVGDRVMIRARGCFAEYVATNAGLASPIPPALDWVQAAAVPVGFITAWEALVQYGRLKAGETALIVGASSGVGVAAIQIAHALGARVIGTTGSQQKLATLRELGADVALCARGNDFSPSVKDVTGGKGADVAVNLVGGTAFPATLRSLADFGRIAIVGYVDGVLTTELDLEAVHGKRLEIFGISNSPLTPAMRIDATAGFNRDVLPALADGRIKPVVDSVFALDDIVAAKARVDSGALIGKVVLRFD